MSKLHQRSLPTEKNKERKRPEKGSGPGRNLFSAEGPDWREENKEKKMHLCQAKRGEPRTKGSHTGMHQ